MNNNTNNAAYATDLKPAITKGALVWHVRSGLRGRVVDMLPDDSTSVVVQWPEWRSTVRASVLVVVEYDPTARVFINSPGGTLSTSVVNMVNYLRLLNAAYVDGGPGVAFFSHVGGHASLSGFGNVAVYGADADLAEVRAMLGREDITGR